MQPGPDFPLLFADVSFSLFQVRSILDFIPHVEVSVLLMITTNVGNKNVMDVH